METKSPPLGLDFTKALIRELKEWWADESAPWETKAAGTAGAGLPGGSALWGAMPQVDSKVVAKSSPTFERYFGRPLDVKLIRPGGYTTIDAMISHLVPAMQAAGAGRSVR